MITSLQLFLILSFRENDVVMAGQPEEVGYGLGVETSDMMPALISASIALSDNSQ